ncbi:STAS domain-containing protein [Flaviramulus sp. BrNp1-15]|uniref:STAS domain-containing protein n=1 Tax=Flaviramulus sp. BrNp1-15 TaxID=2916754 RepID=UPI001EE844A3|nr:STAS domain-containing protein [Flaviramulus sp. BrNp1-15]ULC60346.1 STAS domain-containing protein [Flaviramulus sp. BrNp1-15]
MSLSIKQQGKIFLIKGSINETTIKQFKNHLEFLLLFSKSLTINIDGVKLIDRSGMKVLKELNAISLMYKKKFEIIGYGCKDIYDELYNHAA